MINNIKGAIFDMDGTLVNSLMLWEIVWKKFGDVFCGGKGFKPTNEDDKKVRTMILRDAMNFIHEQYSIGKSGAELLEETNKIILRFYSEEVMLKAGVADFLEYCQGNGIKMCIASATDIKFVKLAAKHCKIEKYFSDILSCATLGKGKDKPDIYLQALECLGTSKDETCVFEDSHVAIETAAGLGLKTVGIYDQYNSDQDKIREISTVYIAEGETLKKLIGQE